MKTMINLLNLKPQTYQVMRNIPEKGRDPEAKTKSILDHLKGPEVQKRVITNHLKDQEIEGKIGTDLVKDPGQEVIVKKSRLVWKNLRKDQDLEVRTKCATDLGKD